MKLVLRRNKKQYDVMVTFGQPPCTGLLFLVYAWIMNSRVGLSYLLGKCLLGIFINNILFTGEVERNTGNIFFQISEGYVRQCQT